MQAKIASLQEQRAQHSQGYDALHKELTNMQVPLFAFYPEPSASSIPPRFTELAEACLAASH